MNVTTVLPNIATVVKSATLSFTWIDYGIFTAMLFLSVLIGIYFGCFGSKQSSAKEYLMGGKSMKVFPVAMSLVASHISGITLLSIPADVYWYGSGNWLCVISLFVMTLVTIFVYLPVFFNLGITSTYEYLQRRFDEKTRMFASFLFALSQFLFLPIVVYIPALAFSAATGINLHLITPIVCGVCIFYTTIGGLKAVIWTDTLQFSITVLASLVIVYLGLEAAGGFGHVWSTAVKGERLDILDFTFDITKRDQFWALAIGYSFHWIAQANTNQGSVQKFFSVGTLSEAKWLAFYHAIGLSIMKSISVITGLIIYTHYVDCDPFATKQITKKDQLLPHYVLDVGGNIPGLPGLFIAGVFSAGLSTLSAHLNCLSGTLYEDFLSKWLPKDISETSKSNILKWIVVVAGIICTVLVFIFEHLGGVLPLSIAFNGITQGPMLGMFTLGVLFRKANAKGAFYGGIAGVIGLSGLVAPAQYFQSMGLFSYPQKPVTVEGCGLEFNSSIIAKNVSHLMLNETSASDGETPDILKISFYYYNLIGCLITVIVGLIISYLTNNNEDTLDENLLSPLIQRTSSQDNKIRNEIVEYHTLEKAINLVTVNSANDTNETYLKV